MAKITASRFNDLQSRIATILGNGSGQFGYGQLLKSEPVLAGVLIDNAQVENLRDDLLRARQHQSGKSEVSNFPEPIEGFLITDTIFSQYETQMAQIETSKFSIGTNQAINETVITRSRSTSWNGTILHNIVVDFGSEDLARHFFNAGGYLSFKPSFVDYGDSLGLSWSSLLNGIGTVRFNYTSTTKTGNNGTANTIGFYDLTTEFQEIFIASGQDLYALNNYRVLAKADLPVGVTVNDEGNTRYVRFRIEFNDNKDTTYDLNVNGVLTSLIQHYRPDGSNVNIISPVYADTFTGGTTTLIPGPTAYAATVSATAIDVYWSEIPDILTYELFRAASLSGSWTTIYTGILKDTGNRYHDTGLQNNTTYYYRVRAVTPETSNYSNIANARTGTAISTPELTGTALTKSTVSLTWTSMPTATSYNLQRCATNTFSSNVTTTVFNGVSSTTVTGLSPNTTYYFRVNAVDSNSIPTVTTNYSTVVKLITAPEVTISSTNEAVVLQYGISYDDNTYEDLMVPNGSTYTNVTLQPGTYEISLWGQSGKGIGTGEQSGFGGGGGYGKSVLTLTSVTTVNLFSGSYGTVGAAGTGDLPGALGGYASAIIATTGNNKLVVPGGGGAGSNGNEVGATNYYSGGGLAEGQGGSAGNGGISGGAGTLGAGGSGGSSATGMLSGLSGNGGRFLESGSWNFSTKENGINSGRYIDPISASAGESDPNYISGIAEPVLGDNNYGPGFIYIKNIVSELNGISYNGTAYSRLTVADGSTYSNITLSPGKYKISLWSQAGEAASYSAAQAITTRTGGRGTSTFTVDFGNGTGSCGISYEAYSNPDSFSITWNGQTVTSGFRGSTSYNSALVQAGYTNVTGPGQGTLLFDKTSASPSTATVTVIGAFTGTEWKFTPILPPGGYGAYGGSGAFGSSVISITQSATVSIYSGSYGTVGAGGTSSDQTLDGGAGGKASAIISGDNKLIVPGGGGASVIKNASATYDIKLNGADVIKNGVFPNYNAAGLGNGTGGKSNTAYQYNSNRDGKDGTNYAGGGGAALSIATGNALTSGFAGQGGVFFESGAWTFGIKENGNPGGIVNVSMKAPGGTQPDYVGSVALPTLDGSNGSAYVVIEQVEQSVINTLMLDWTESLELSKYYEIQRSMRQSGPFAVVDTATDNQLADQNLLPGTIYYYQVRTVTNDDPIIYSALSEVTGGATAPDIYAFAISETTIYVEWEGPEQVIYQLEWANSDTGSTVWTVLPTLKDRSYTHTGVSQNNFYYYRIKIISPFTTGYAKTSGVKPVPVDSSCYSPNPILTLNPVWGTYTGGYWHPGEVTQIIDFGNKTGECGIEFYFREYDYYYHHYYWYGRYYDDTHTVKVYWDNILQKTITYTWDRSLANNYTKITFNKTKETPSIVTLVYTFRGYYRNYWWAYGYYHNWYGYYYQPSISYRVLTPMEWKSIDTTNYIWHHHWYFNWHWHNYAWYGLTHYYQYFYSNYYYYYWNFYDNDIKSINYYWYNYGYSGWAPNYSAGLREWWVVRPLDFGKYIGNCGVEFTCTGIPAEWVYYTNRGDTRVVTIKAILFYGNQRYESQEYEICDINGVSKSISSRFLFNKAEKEFLIPGRLKRTTTKGSVVFLMKIGTRWNVNYFYSGQSAYNKMPKLSYRILCPSETQLISNFILATPTGVTATFNSFATTHMGGVNNSLGSCGVKLTWNTVTNAAEYVISKSVNIDDNYEHIPMSSTLTSTSYIDTDVKEGQTIYYKIQGKNVNDISDYSAKVSITVGYSDPVVTLTPSSTSMKVKWKGIPSQPYIVERSTTGATGTFTTLTYNVGTIQIINGEINYTDTNLTPVTQYHYRVKANTVAVSQLSKVAGSKTQYSTPVIGVPVTPIAPNVLASRFSVRLPMTGLNNTNRDIQVQKKINNGQWLDLQKSFVGVNTTWPNPNTTYNYDVHDTSIQYDSDYYYRAFILTAPGSAYSTELHVRFNSDQSCPTSYDDVIVTAKSTGSVWGDGIYKSDSSMAAVAVHSGLAQVDQTVKLTLTARGAQSTFIGTTKNGVTSNAWTGNACGVSVALAQLPAPPVITLTAVPVSSSRIQLSWTIATTESVTYTVVRSGFGTIYQGSGLSVIDQGLAANTQYTYTISAPVNSDLQTSTTTVVRKTNHVAVSQISISRAVNGLRLEWAALPASVSYSILRAQKNIDDTWTTFTSVGSTTLVYYTDTTVVSEVDYAYKISVVEPDSSDDSAIVYATG